MSNFFNKKIYLDRVDSTNTYLKKNNFPDKTLAYSFNQTKGKGRNNKVWSGTSGKNLALSVLLKPGFTVQNPLWFVAACSIALVKYLERLDIKNSWIKWPNDIHIEHKKLSGILTEVVWKAGVQEKVIVGIGININNTPEELANIPKPATSIFLEKGEKQDIGLFTEEYTEELTKWVRKLYEKKLFGEIKENWLSYCDISRKQVQWKKDNGQVITGTVHHFDDDGFLILSTGQGNFKVISGDITILT